MATQETDHGSERHSRPSMTYKLEKDTPVYFTSLPGENLHMSQDWEGMLFYQAEPAFVFTGYNSQTRSPIYELTAKPIFTRYAPETGAKVDRLKTVSTTNHLMIGHEVDDNDLEKILAGTKAVEEYILGKNYTREELRETPDHKMKEINSVGRILRIILQKSQLKPVNFKAGESEQQQIIEFMQGILKSAGYDGLAYPDFDGPPYFFQKGMFLTFFNPQQTLA